MTRFSSIFLFCCFHGVNCLKFGIRKSQGASVCKNKAGTRFAVEKKTTECTASEKFKQATIPTQKYWDSQSLAKTSYDKALFMQGNETRVFEAESLSKYWHHSYSHNEFRLQRAMKTLVDGNDANKEFSIVVLGGSVTAEQTHNDGCSWKNKHHWVAGLGELMHTTWGERVKVTNLAQPATTSDYPVKHWHTLKSNLEAADVILVEYGFNDYIKGKWGSKKYIERSKTNEKSNTLLMHMLLQLPKPAVLFLELPGKEALRYTQFPRIEESNHFPGAKQFGIPMIWYPAFERQVGRPMWGLNEHPPCFPSHHAMSAMVHGVFKEVLNKVCQDGVQGADAPLPALSTGPQCSQDPVFFAFAQSGSKAFPTKSNNGWEFYEDREGKPGWIAKKGQQSEIVFSDIPIKKGGLEIEYLRSYENLGKVSCKLEGNKDLPQGKNKEITLDGIWESCLSLVQTFTMKDIPSGTYDLRCRSDGEKFKITGLLTC